MKTEGLLCFVLRPAGRSGDCTNGGITSKCNSVILCDVPGPFAPNATSPAMRLVRRRIRSGDYIHAEPVDQPTGMNGPMFGGNFIHTSDARFPNDYPIPVHDRFETWGTA